MLLDSPQQAHETGNPDMTAVNTTGKARLLNFCIVSTIFCGSAAAPTAFMALVAVAMLWPTVDVAAVVCTRMRRTPGSALANVPLAGFSA